MASCSILGWVTSGPGPSQKKSTQLSIVNFVSTHVLKVACEAKNEYHTDFILFLFYFINFIGLSLSK